MGGRAEENPEGRERSGEKTPREPEKFRVTLTPGYANLAAVCVLARLVARISDARAGARALASGGPR